MLLAIDQSLRSSGINIFDNNNNLVHIEIIKTIPNTPTKETIQIIINRLRELVDEYHIENIAMEGLALRAIGRSSKCLAGLYHVIQFAFDIPIIVIEIGTVKKKATGKGNAKKADIILCLPNHILYKFINAGHNKKELSDLADSYWIGQCAKEIK